MKLTGSEVQAVAAAWWLDNVHVAKHYQNGFYRTAWNADVV